ncbi:MAG: DUF4270 family protein [Chryseolinea sp.]
MKFETALGLFALTICLACSDRSEIGSNFFSKGSLDLIYSDTVTVHASTVLIDSLDTSTATRMLVGYHKDTDLGNLTCNAYFNLGPDDATSLEEVNTAYSRLSLILYYDNYSYYDTVGMQTFSVHRLKEFIEAAGDGKLYNTSAFAYDENPLGQLSFIAFPNRLDSIEIPLTDELGEQLYALSKASSTKLSNSGEFLNLLRGFIVKADTSINGAILGFSTNAQLRLYYFDKSVQPTEEKHLSFSIDGSASATAYFNSIKGDRRNTLLAELKTRRDPINADVTNDRFYLQGGSGLIMRIELPYIKSILQDDENLIIAAAFLKIKPIRSVDRVNCALPPELKVYTVNGRNEILSEFSSAQLVVDGYLDRDSYYLLEIKSYVQQQLAIDEFNNYALLLQISDDELASSVTRLYGGGPDSDNELEIGLQVVTVDVEN